MPAMVRPKTVATKIADRLLGRQKRKSKKDKLEVLIDKKEQRR